MNTKLIFILYFLGVGCNALSLNRNRRQLDVEIDMTTQLPVHDEEKDRITTEKTFFTIEPEITTQPNLEMISDYIQYIEQNNNTDAEIKYTMLQNIVKSYMENDESIEEVTGSSLISLNAAFPEEVLSRFISDTIKTDQDNYEIEHDAKSSELIDILPTSEKINNHQKRDSLAQNTTEKKPSSTTQEPLINFSSATTPSGGTLSPVPTIFSQITNFFNPPKPVETHKPAANFPNENDSDYMEPLLIFDDNFNPITASDFEDPFEQDIEASQLSAPTNIEVASPPPEGTNFSSTYSNKSELMAVEDDQPEPFDSLPPLEPLPPLDPLPADDEVPAGSRFGNADNPDPFVSFLSSVVNYYTMVRRSAVIIYGFFSGIFGNR